MMTISLCMIVKNEERVLARCLDSVADLCDEIIIVDTGSTDSTKEIATKYTDKIYDFEWIDDFSAARNYAFSLATMDYIYSADADEVLDEENRNRFSLLKRSLLPEIEIVQMKYGNQLSFGTVYNFDEEYRPKLFKRLRTFTWIEPVHEEMRLDPVVFDSDIVITHMPENNHSSRDFRVFDKQLARSGGLSDRLWEMFARELFISGESEDFKEYLHHFIKKQDETVNPEMYRVVSAVVCRAARMLGDTDLFFKNALKLIADEGCSEVCNELGLWYEEKGDLQEASIWFYNAVYEVTPIIKAATGGREPLEHLVKIYTELGDMDAASKFSKELENC